MDQGEHVFERFGHAAVCVVYDSTSSKSRCYNYGTTDFGSPPERLGWEFLRGTSRFWVSVWTPKKMIAAYERADRTIWRQRLPLDDAEARRVASKLASDSLDENRYYVYHHFDDNCSTRVRDIIDDATGGRLRQGADGPLGPTYRDLGRAGLAEQKLFRQASRLLVGRRADEKPTEYDAMFLPQVLRRAVQSRFGVAPELIHRRAGRKFEQAPTAEWPYEAAAAASLAGLVWLGARRSRVERALLVVVGSSLGLVAVVVWLTAFVSTVPELRWNEAMLVFWPTDLALPWLSRAARVKYARVRLLALLAVSLGVAVGVLHQPLLALVLVPGLAHAVVARGNPRPVD